MISAPKKLVQSRRNAQQYAAFTFENLPRINYRTWLISTVILTSHYVS